MAVKKDKEKVFGGDWTEEQLKDYLTASPLANCSQEYSAVYKAYQHMVPEAFNKFIELYCDAGMDRVPKNADGVSIYHTIKGHNAMQEYAQILEKAGFE